MIYSHEVEMMCPVPGCKSRASLPIPKRQSGYRLRKLKIFAILRMVSAGAVPQQGACNH